MIKENTTLKKDIYIYLFILPSSTQPENISSILEKKFWMRTLCHKEALGDLTSLHILGDQWSGHLRLNPSWAEIEYFLHSSPILAQDTC